MTDNTAHSAAPAVPVLQIPLTAFAGVHNTRTGAGTEPGDGFIARALRHHSESAAL